MSSDLSGRGRALVDTPPMSPYWQAHHERRHQGYDPVTNPDGYIGLCVAENKTVWDLLAPRLTAARPHLGHDSICYDDMIGCSSFRTQLADFMARHVHGRRFDPDHIAALAGTGSVLEILFYCIADAGDAILVPTPSYSGFWADLETRNELTIVPVPTDSEDGFALTDELLDAAFESSERPVRALLYTNPDNPTGAVASRREMERVVHWSQQKGIHLVVDEVYALSVHGNAEFRSVAQVVPDLGESIHLIWAFSKDFGASGLRCGVLITENRRLMEAISSLAYWSAVSGETQHVLGEMIADDEWVNGYIPAMQRRLHDSYASVTKVLAEAGVPFFPAQAGFFFLLDLREHLDEPTWEAEDALWQRIIDETNVNLTPGSACRNPEPGFLRLCFSNEPPAVAMEGARRIARILGH